MSEDFKKQQHQTEMGQVAHVEREEAKSDFTSQAAAALRSIGLALGASDEAAKHCKYMGSAAVHIYQSEMLGQVMFFSQASPLGNCPEATASDAVNDLMKSCMKHYGRKPPEKRSGF